MKKITIEIGKGEIKVEADGFKGNSCIPALDQINKIIGGKVKWKRKKIFGNKQVNISAKS